MSVCNHDCAKAREYYEANKENAYNRDNGDKLRISRKERGYTQTHLARLVGVSQGLISMFETGTVPFEWKLFDGVLEVTP